MELTNEREVDTEMVEFDIDLSQEECKLLKEYALKTIVDDEAALINYAVNALLKEAIEKAEKTNKELRKAGKKNGKG